MKKITTLLQMLTLAVAAHAQFQQGKAYLGASLTGVDLNYTGKNGLNLGIEGKAGYLLEDNWMVLAQASLKHTGSSDAASSFTAGIGGRYYIVQNGLYLGANLKYLHADHSYNDLMPGAEVGYAFYINRSVTIEPAIYYDHSFNNSDYSTVGLKVGIGIYLFDD